MFGQLLWREQRKEAPSGRCGERRSPASVWGLCDDKWEVSLLREAAGSELTYCCNENIIFANSAMAGLDWKIRETGNEPAHTKKFTAVWSFLAILLQRKIGHICPSWCLSLLYDGCWVVILLKPHVHPLSTACSRVGCQGKHLSR